MKRRMTPQVVGYSILIVLLTAGAAQSRDFGKIYSRDIVKGAVHSSDIKNNAIRSIDIRNRTIRPDDINLTSLGASLLANIDTYTVTHNFPASYEVSGGLVSDVRCDRNPGDPVLSGGYTGLPADFTVIGSGPDFDRTGWLLQFSVSADGPASAGGLTTYAVCLDRLAATLRQLKDASDQLR